MNRTLSPSLPALVPSTYASHTAWPRKRKPAPPACQSESGSHHCLFSPINYEPGYAYPLVVWLHGPESSELELRQVMSLVSTRNYVGVAPRGTLRNSERAYSWEQTTSAVAEACQRVRDCLEIARQQFNVHEDRVFVAGYGVGGTMALRVGMEHPELFAGAISLAGRVPRGGNAFRRINVARSLPLMLSVSPTETEFTKQEVMDDLRLLHCGGFTLSLNLYPEGDSLTDEMLVDVNSWMMQLSCPSVVTAAR